MDKTQREIVSKVFAILVMKAQEKETTTYEEIAKLTGLPDTGNAMAAALGKVLTVIYDWCKTRGQPPLTAIVVRKSGTDAGLPGNGFWKLRGQEDLSRNDRMTTACILVGQVWDYYDLV